MGLYLYLRGKPGQMEEWLDGSPKVCFGYAADKVKKHARILALESLCHMVGKKRLFPQVASTVDSQGGAVRMLWAELSGYAHGRPGCMDGDMWGGTGPNFSNLALKEWSEMLGRSLVVAAVLTKVAKPECDRFAWGVKERFEGYLGRAGTLVPENDLFRILAEQLPKTWWNPKC